MAKNEEVVDMLPVALAGFRQAVERHLYPDQDSYARLFISATECAYWASILDDRLRSTPGYQRFLQEHPAGRVLPGVRYIRNLKTHSLPMTIRKTSGLTFPVTFPVSFGEVVWLPFESLPPPQRVTSYTPEQVMSYQQSMAGKPTQKTFAVLDDGFTFLETLPRSPLTSVVPDVQRLVGNSGESDLG